MISTSHFHISLSVKITKESPHRNLMSDDCESNILVINVNFKLHIKTVNWRIYSCALSKLLLIQAILSLD